MAENTKIFRKRQEVEKIWGKSDIDELVQGDILFVRSWWSNSCRGLAGRAD